MTFRYVVNRYRISDDSFVKVYDAVASFVSRDDAVDYAYAMSGVYSRYGYDVVDTEGHEG